MDGSGWRHVVLEGVQGSASSDYFIYIKGGSHRGRPQGRLLVLLGLLLLLVLLLRMHFS